MSTLSTLAKDKQKIVVTMGLPYANGSLHLGHLLGFIQADIYTRFLKHIGQEAIYVCASDQHGTPITVNAKKANMKPLEYTNQFFDEHQTDLKKFNVQFDNFHKTHSKENKELALHFFNTLKEKGLIYTKEINQLFDEKAKQFLPDRFIKGECPKCHTKEQYGDICESCNTTYEPTDLISPKSTITGTKPILKKTTHYYFKLSKCQTKLKSWLENKSNPLQKQVKNFALNWIKEGLNDWCISRDEPYFGFEIPNSTKETGAKKFLYVWLDAPIGYISSTMDYCNKQNKSSTASKLTWQDYWQNKSSQPIHFIGKDIMYFHLLFWPAMLMEMGIELPIVSVNGFINVDGKKMSKSRGTFFTASQFHELYGGEHLRYYLASHSDRTVTDINLSFQDFKAVSNNVLLASLGNFFYRTLSFAAKNYSNNDSSLPLPACSGGEKALNKQVNFLIEEIRTHYLEQNLKEATNKIIKIADLGNQYFQAAQPWKKLDTTDQTKIKQHQKLIVSQVSWCVNLTKTLSILIKPVMPILAKKVETSLSLKPQSWQDLEKTPSWKGQVKQPEKMLDKIEIKEDKKQDSANGSTNSSEFPVDIRVGQIVEVKDHPEADKLYVLKVDFGKKIKQRQIVAGIKEAYEKDDLLNKKALFIVNLQEATIRNQKSNGMSLVAESKDKTFTLLWVGDKTKLGTKTTFNESTAPVKDKDDSILSEIDFKTWQKQKLKILDKTIQNKQGQTLTLNSKPIIDNKVDGSKVM